MCADRSRLPSQEMQAKYVHAVTCQPANNPGETPHDIVAEAIELELSTKPKPKPPTSTAPCGRAQPA